MNRGSTWFVVGSLAAVGLVLGSVGSPESTTVIYAAVGVIVVASIGRRMASEADKQWLPAAVSAAYLIKLAASGMRFGVLEFIYGGRGDATGYHGAGHELVSVWRGFDVPEITIGTGFLDAATGFLYVPHVPTMLGGFFLFATVAFLGQLMLYAAFRKSADLQHIGWYAVAVLFLPTIVYWPSSIGKESLMFLFLGLASLGAAGLLKDYRLRWAGLFGLGVAGAAGIRPHIALLLVVSLAVALLFGKRQSGTGLLGRRTVAIGVIAVVLVGAAAVTASQFGIDFASGLEATEDFENVITNVEGATSRGGSSVTGSSIKSPQEFPAGFLKVLFRPFPQEANNEQALASSFEGMLLLGVFLWRLVPILRNGWHIRRHPYLVFALVFTVGFIVAFSAFNNFGLLARQRSQVMPYFMALLIALGWSTRQESVATGNSRTRRASQPFSA